MSVQPCSKIRFQFFSDAAVQATLDETVYKDKRKVYYHWDCQAWHTSREKVKTDVGLLER